MKISEAGTMTVIELYRALDARFPKSLSCPWDSDGLMICKNPNREVHRVMLALDATTETVRAACETGAEVLLTHHPLLFRPLKAVTPFTMSGARALGALCGDVAVLSFHTRLDAADGGVNDALAARLGLSVTGKFGDEESPSLGRLASLAVPVSAADFAARVRDALGAPAVRLTGARPVQTVALVGGDGKDLISAAMAAGADTLVTGDASYNAALDAAEDGLNIIEAGHYYTEAPVLEPLAELVTTLTGAVCTVADSNMTKYI